MTLPNDTIKPKAMTLTQLAQQYKVCTKTLRKWLKPFSADIGTRQNTYIFTPEQVAKIYERIGEP